MNWIAIPIWDAAVAAEALYKKNNEHAIFLDYDDADEAEKSLFSFIQPEDYILVQWNGTRGALELLIEETKARMDIPKETTELTPGIHL